MSVQKALTKVRRFILIKSIVRFLTVGEREWLQIALNEYDKHRWSTYAEAGVRTATGVAERNAVLALQKALLEFIPTTEAEEAEQYIRRWYRSPSLERGWTGRPVSR